MHDVSMFLSPRQGLPSLIRKPQNACNACWLGLVQRLSMQSLCWAMNHFFPNRLEVFLVTADSFKTCNGKKAPAHSKTSFSDCVHASAWWCLSLPTNYINCLDSRHFTLGAEEQRTYGNKQVFCFRSLSSRIPVFWSSETLGLCFKIQKACEW